MDLGHELASAAAQGNLAKVRELLAQGLDPNGLNAYGRTPIQTELMTQTHHSSSCFRLPFHYKRSALRGTGRE
ncbi:hypothetical protein Y1Q_0000321 [Alligator mississippiensis]|uniref:Uncharacterized protein n=1 Tax=Alligator mississippiensis TaxID=8496 RepID=A0A151LZ81_ALLMI|nr:hypothetical protein Y1Q_0000321 [Alligator mississippiensis]